MVEVPVFELARFSAELRENKFQFVAGFMNDGAPGFGTDTDPVQACGCGDRAVRFHGDFEAA